MASQVHAFRWHRFSCAITFGAVFLCSAAAVDQDEAALVKQASFLSPEDKELLNAYHHSFDDDRVDIDLIISLLCKIHCRSQNGVPTFFRQCYFAFPDNNNYYSARYDFE